MTIDDTTLLLCPSCHDRLTFRGDLNERALHRGTLTCGSGEHEWQVRDGVPMLIDESAVRGTDWLMRLIYDGLAVLHDPAVRFLLPALQGSSAQALRDGYMPRLELDDLRSRPDREPLRILEVGVGTGANLPLLDRDLPPDLDVELWGCDLSSGMLDQCRERLSDYDGRPMKLLLADAHALPFATASFDRVFHVGGIAGYRDPATALHEMARVARPGTPIVVVDEQLDPRQSHGLYYWLAFRSITFFTSEAVCPRAGLPAAVVDVREEQISRFYYCLSFRTPSTTDLSVQRP